MSKKNRGEKALPWEFFFGPPISKFYLPPWLEKELIRLIICLVFLPGFFSSSLPLSNLEMAETLGTVFLSQIPSLISLSRTSQENTPGFSIL